MIAKPVEFHLQQHGAHHWITRFTVILAIIREMIDQENVTALHITRSSAEAPAIADQVVTMKTPE